MIPVAGGDAERRRARSLRAGFLLVGAGVAAAVGYGVTRLATGSSGGSVPIAGRPLSVAVAASVVPSDLVFATSSLGYELVNLDSHTYLAATENGGRSWTTVSPPLASAKGLSDEAITDVGVSGDGAVYAYGSWPGRIVDVSSDQGRTWRRTELPGTVAEVTSSGATLDALVDGPDQPLAPNAHRAPQPPAAWLYTSGNDGRSWSLRSRLPKSIGPYSLLVQPSPETAYALSPGENNTIAGRYGGLVRTTDGGRTWSVVQQPCDVDASPRFAGNVEFGAANASELWMVCGDSFKSAPGNVTQVARSSDGGQQWSIVAGTQWFMPPGKANFPGTSAVPSASPAATSLFSADTAWLVLGPPATLVRTTDGGTTWSALPPSLVDQGPLFVVPAGESVEVRTGTALWQDRGGSWRVLSLADSEALGDGIDTVDFGTTEALAIAKLDAFLGAPTKSSDLRGDCNVTSAVQWKGIVAYFFQGRFAGYQTGTILDGSTSSPDVTTAAGLRIGDSIGHLKQLYGTDLRLSGEQGGAWFAKTDTGTLDGYLSDELWASSKVASIGAGSLGCPAMSP